MTSSDGNTWTQRSTVPSAAALTGISGNSSYYVATGITKSGSSNFILDAVITDLTAWSVFTTTNSAFSSLSTTTDGGLSKPIVTSSGVGYISSPTGVVVICHSNCTNSSNWVFNTVNNASTNSAFIAENNGIVVYANGGSIFYSTNGSSFSKASQSYIASEKAVFLSVLNGRYVIITSNSTSNNFTFIHLRMEIHGEVQHKLSLLRIPMDRFLIMLPILY